MEQIHHFELERSNDGSNWTMLNASIAPTETSYSGDTEIPAVGSSFYYRLTGKTSPSGLDIPYNIVSLLNPGADPGTCLLQRHFGAINPTTDGAVIKRIRVNAFGEVIVCGQLIGNANNFGGVTLGTLIPNGGQDAWVAKYSADGTLQWAMRWGGASDDVAYDCAFDSSGNVICTGSVATGPFPGTMDFGFGPVATKGGSEVFVLKVTPAGVLIYFKLFGGSGADEGLAVVLDSSDNIYLAGYHGFFGTGIDFGGGPLARFGSRDVFLAKLTSAGAYVWAVSYGGGDDDIPNNLAIHSSGVYMTGSFRGTADFGTGNITATGGRDAFLGKYSLVDGSALWVRHLSGQPGTDDSDQLIGGLDCDSSGTVVVAGGFTRVLVIQGGPTINISPEAGLFIVKYSEAGNFVWQTHFISQYNPAIITGVAIDTLGEVTFCGEMVTGIDFGTGFLLGQGGNNLMLVKLSSAGTTIWARRGAPFGDQGFCIDVHPVTRQLLVGQACSREQQFIARYNALQVILTVGTVNNTFWTRWQP